MPYLSGEQLKAAGFKAMGQNLKTSDKTAAYLVNQIEIGEHSRIDDFWIMFDKVRTGRSVHIDPHCLVASSENDIVLDDDSARKLAASALPAVCPGRHVIDGAGTIIFP